jgi:hypothetical protein
MVILHTPVDAGQTGDPEDIAFPIHERFAR